MNKASENARPSPASPAGRPLGQRLHALWALWCYRRSWRLPAGRSALRAERNREITELMPFVLLTAALGGVGLFVLLPLGLGGQAALVLQQVWPLILVFAAPWGCATLMAWLSAPHLALRLSEFAASGMRDEGVSPLSTRAALYCVPLLLAHTLVCMAASALLLLFMLAIGLTANLVLHAGDLGDLASIAFSTPTPLQWLQTWCHAALLGMASMLGTVLYAWPGTQLVNKGLDAHRLGLRATLASMIANSGVAALLLSLQIFLSATSRIA